MMCRCLSFGGFEKTSDNLVTDNSDSLSSSLILINFSLRVLSTGMSSTLHKIMVVAFRVEIRVTHLPEGEGMCGAIELHLHLNCFLQIIHSLGYCYVDRERILGSVDNPTKEL